MAIEKIEVEVVDGLPYFPSVFGGGSIRGSEKGHFDLEVGNAPADASLIYHPSVVLTRSTLHPLIGSYLRFVIPLNLQGLFHYV